MRVVRVFVDDSGESHFEDPDIPMDPVSYGRASRELPAGAVSFRETDSGGTLDFHNRRDASSSSS
jgi:hypothetical protein